MHARGVELHYAVRVRQTAVTDTVVEWIELDDIEDWVASHQVVPDSVAIVVPLLRGG